MHDTKEREEEKVLCTKNGWIGGGDGRRRENKEIIN